MRHKYRVLTEQEKAMMVALKDKGAEFIELLHIVGGNPGVDKMASRDLSIAQTKIEEAVMWAVKQVTG